MRRRTAEFARNESLADPLGLTLAPPRASVDRSGVAAGRAASIGGLPTGVGPADEETVVGETGGGRDGSAVATGSARGDGAAGAPRPAPAAPDPMASAEARIAKDPKMSYVYNEWVTTAIANPTVIDRDPVRALEMAERAHENGDAAVHRLADVLLGRLDGLSESARESAFGYVQMYPRGFRGTLLGALALKSERGHWIERLDRGEIDDSVIALAAQWRYLTPELHERLRRVAIEPRTDAAARLAEVLLEVLPNDPGLAEHARWAMRTPAYLRRANVIAVCAANGDRVALGLLRAAIRSSNVLEQADAAIALVYPRLDAETTPLVRSLSPYVRTAAAYQLSRRVDPVALRLLANLPDVRPVGVSGGFGGPSYPREAAGMPAPKRSTAER